MATSNKTIVPLSAVPVGARAHVHGIAGGREVLGRLATLGFTPGASLTMIQNYGHGPLIVSIRDARIALGRGEASKVQVVLENESSI